MKIHKYWNGLVKYQIKNKSSNLCDSRPNASRSYCEFNYKLLFRLLFMNSGMSTISTKTSLQRFSFNYNSYLCKTWNSKTLTGLEGMVWTSPFFLARETTWEVDFLTFFLTLWILINFKECFSYRYLSINVITDKSLMSSSGCLAIWIINYRSSIIEF